MPKKNTTKDTVPCAVLKCTTEKNEHFWNRNFFVAVVVAAVGAYAYAIPILLQHGKNVYFNTHPGFVDVSLRDAIIWFYELSRNWQMFASAIVEGIMAVWWKALGSVLVFVVIWLIYFFSDKLKLPQWYANFIKFLWVVALLFVVCSFFILSLKVWYEAGYNVTANQTNHLVLAPGCGFAEPDTAYVVTSIYEGKAVLVPVDRNTHKMQEQFFVKELSALTCGMAYEELGRIER